MAVTLVQSKTFGSSSDNTFHFATFNSAPTTGNLVIAAVGAGSSVSGIAGVTSTWSLAVSTSDSTSIYIYYGFVDSGGGTVDEVDITMFSSNSCCIQIFEYSGIVASSPLDKTASAVGQGAASTISTGTTATTTTADQLLFGFVSKDGSLITVSSWSNSFTAVASAQSTISSFNVMTGSAARTVSTTATYTTTATMSASTGGDDCGAIATFKAVAAATQVLRQPGRFLGLPGLMAQ